MKAVGRESRTRNKPTGGMVHRDRRLTQRLLVKNRDAIRKLEGRESVSLRSELLPQDLSVLFQDRLCLILQFRV